MFLQVSESAYNDLWSGSVVGLCGTARFYTQFKTRHRETRRSKVYQEWPVCSFALSDVHAPKDNLIAVLISRLIPRCFWGLPLWPNGRVMAAHGRLAAAAQFCESAGKVRESACLRWTFQMIRLWLIVLRNHDGFVWICVCRKCVVEKLNFKLIWHLYERLIKKEFFSVKQTYAILFSIVKSWNYEFCNKIKT